MIYKSPLTPGLQRGEEKVYILQRGEIHKSRGKTNIIPPLIKGDEGRFFKDAFIQ